MLGFKIDKDHIDTEQEGSVRTYGGGPEADPPDSAFNFPFRLYDDDGILYYEGRALDAESAEEAWRWGAYFAGSVRLDEKRDDAWTPMFG